MGNLIKKVAESAVKPDKNGRNYKTITVATLGTSVQNIPGVGNVTVHSPVKTASMNVYESSYLNNQEEFGYSLPVGSLMMGNIVTRTVEPYTIVNRENGEVRTVNTYTCAVLGDTDDEGFETLVEKTIARRFASAIV